MLCPLIFDIKLNWGLVKKIWLSLNLLYLPHVSLVYFILSCLIRNVYHIFYTKWKMYCIWLGVILKYKMSYLRNFQIKLSSKHAIHFHWLFTISSPHTKSLFPLILSFQKASCLPCSLLTLIWLPSLSVYIIMIM